MKFIDTNVLVYYVDRRDPAKREKARSIVVEAVRNGGFAITYRDRYELQFYDSLLLVAAEDGGCDEFLSEDLNDGQLYCGIRAVNPFK